MQVIRQLVVFCAIGGVNTAVGIVVVLLLMGPVGFGYVVANLGGLSIGVMVSFLLHREITFASTRKLRSGHGQAFWFLSVFSVAYFVQLGVLVVLVEGVRAEKEIAQVIACTIYTLLGFIGNRCVTFAGRRREPGPRQAVSPLERQER